MARSKDSNKLLANSLTYIKDKSIIQSNDIPRTHLERLIQAGFLGGIINGWYFVTKPNIDPFSTTPFFMNYYEFIKKYTDKMYPNSYVSLESAISLHVHSHVIPTQLCLNIPEPKFNLVDFKNGYSLLINGRQKSLAPKDSTILNGLICPTIPYLLVHLTPQSWQQHPDNIQILLGSTNSVHAFLPYLKDNDAGIARIVSGFRQIGYHDFAQEIEDNFLLLNGKMLPNISNVFVNSKIYTLQEREKTPIFNNIKKFWNDMRDDVLKHTPQSVQLCFQSNDDLSNLIEQHKIQDTYHSLSIEQYKVSEDIIRAVENGLITDISPENREAMATRGYLDAFKKVKEDSIQMYFEEQKTPGFSGKFISKELSKWFLLLWKPSIDANILTVEQLAGYRRHPIFIMNSMHVPVNFDALTDAMDAYFTCLQNEPDAFVRAVLGHWLFGYIHPYFDGNGRMARFIMNAMLTSGGYPWTIINVQNKRDYMAALEEASVHKNIEPFAQFIANNLTMGTHITPHFNTP